MSCESLKPQNTLYGDFDLEKVFSLIDSLSAFSDDEPPLAIEDAKIYLSKIAFICEN